MSHRLLSADYKSKNVALLVISLLLLPLISIGISSADGLNEDIPLWLHEQLGTDPDDPQSLGVYVIYDPDYHTLRYNCWTTYENENSTESIIIARERVVVRRGVALELDGYTDADAEIWETRSGMTPLQTEKLEDGWRIGIPSDSTIGKYVFSLSEGNWTAEMDIFVIYDPRTTSIPEDKLKAYAYDEGGTRPEKDYIVTDGLQVVEGTLRPFGDNREDRWDMYEFSLAAAGGSENTQEAAARLGRVVAQRCVAIPSAMTYQPKLRDASQILFGSGVTQLHGTPFNYTGLTLEDAEILGNNGQTIPGISHLTEDEETKMINAWCDETSWAATALLRSIGIPARVSSVHPSEDTRFMGHFMAEVWFEESLYHTDWGEDQGGWYVLDSDEWNAEWYVSNPVFWSASGECISSRTNYGRMGEVLYMGEYNIDGIYSSGLGDAYELDDFIEVTDCYLEGEDILLDYGTLTKLKGRGGGDYFKVDLRVNSRLSLNSSQSLDAGLYVSEENYPVIPIVPEGYPFQGTVESYVGEEVILGRGTYYIAVYAPKNGHAAFEGDFGEYTLSMESTPHLSPDFDPPDEEPEETRTGIQRYIGHIVGILLLTTWVLSYVVKKKTS
ncbi:MAG: transglutaminase-like domain-containing protein [Thermoplasmata archaeon]